jgi:hypothetical protein
MFVDLSFCLHSRHLPDCCLDAYLHVCITSCLLFCLPSCQIVQYCPSISLSIFLSSCLSALLPICFPAGLHQLRLLILVADDPLLGLFSTDKNDSLVHHELYRLVDLKLKISSWS